MATWEAKLIKKPNSIVNAACGENVVLVLENDAALKGRIRLNDLKGTVEVRLPRATAPTATKATCPWRPLADTDLSSFADYMMRTYGMNVEEGVVGKRVVAVAERYAYDPLRDYLTELKWDGVKRLDGWLTHYLGVPDTQYAQLVGRKFLVGAIARALQPGCKMDTVLILEGPQGINKSTVIQALFGSEFFSDTPIDIGSKDGRIALQGIWGVELAELESLRKSESTKNKAFLSQNSDKFRPPYGKCDIVVLRRNVFLGSSNTDGYLVDETGNRRMWPVRCGTIKLAAVKHDRDQLWAEARVAYEAGEEWWLGKDGEAALAETEADLRVEDDPWAVTLSDWLAPRQHAIVSREEILVGALHKVFRDWDRRATQRLGATMRKLNWRYVRRRQADGLKGYYQFTTDGVLSKDLYVDADVRRSVAIRLANTDRLANEDTVVKLAPPKLTPSA